MSDDYETFNELVERSIEASELLEKPDINKYLYDYEQEWVEAWESAPIESMSNEQIAAFIDMLLEMSFDDWPDFYDSDFDYWEWFRENYEE